MYCIPVGAEEPASRPASDFWSNLEQFYEVFTQCKIETVSFYVLDFRLDTVDFAVAYEHILLLLVSAGGESNFF